MSVGVQTASFSFSKMSPSGRTVSTGNHRDDRGEWTQYLQEEKDCDVYSECFKALCDRRIAAETEKFMSQVM